MQRTFAHDAFPNDSNQGKNTVVIEVINPGIYHSWVIHSVPHETQLIFRYGQEKPEQGLAVIRC
jgi:hypothetical protein